MAIKNRAEATALLAKIKALMNNEVPDLTVRQTTWQKLIDEAVEQEASDAENLADDCRREADNYSDQLNKIIPLMKRLATLLAGDKRSGNERRRGERRRRKVAVAAERRKGKNRRLAERRTQADGAGDFIKRLKIFVKAADKAYSGYETDKDRFTDRVNPKEWDASLIQWVNSDNPDWPKLNKMFKNLFKMDAAG